MKLSVLSPDHNPVLLKLLINNNPYTCIPKKFINWKQFKNHFNCKNFEFPNTENSNDQENFITKITTEINDS